MTVGKEEGGGRPAGCRSNERPNDEVENEERAKRVIRVMAGVYVKPE